MKDRILEFIKYLNIGQNKFEQNCGLSVGNIWRMKGGFSGEGLSKILTTYPDLSPDWLLLGNGPMLRPDNKNLLEVPTTKEDNAKTDIEKFIQDTIKVNIGISEEVERQYRDDNSRLIRQIENMQKMINGLMEEIKELKASGIQQNKNVG